MPCHSSSRPSSPSQSSPNRALSRIAFFAFTTALAGSLAPGLALAEEDTVYLGEITIFANYWEELARKSAVTATVLTEGDLAQPFSPDLDAIAGRSANTVFQRANSQERLVVRGMSAFDNALSDPVGYLVNGVALPMGTIQLPHFFGAENVTLLKGPQGTTFGRNSEAGLLAFDTIRPGSREGGEINLGISGSDAGASPLGGNGSVLWSGRIADGPALAFGLEYARDPGVISNPVTGADNGGESRRVTGFAAAEWDLQDGGYLRLTTLAEDQKFNKEQFRYISGPLATGRYESVYSDPSWERRRASVTALEYGTSFDGFDLTAITGFTTFDRDFVLDFDGSPLPLGITEMDVRDRTISQEIRLTSTGAGPLKCCSAWNKGSDADLVQLSFNLATFWPSFREVTDGVMVFTPRFSAGRAYGRSDRARWQYHPYPCPLFGGRGRLSTLREHFGACPQSVSTSPGRCSCAWASRGNRLAGSSLSLPRARLSGPDFRRTVSVRRHPTAYATHLALAGSCASPRSCPRRTPCSGARPAPSGACKQRHVLAWGAEPDGPRLRTTACHRHR